MKPISPTKLLFILESKEIAEEAVIQDSPLWAKPKKYKTKSKPEEWKFRTEIKNESKKNEKNKTRKKHKRSKK